MNHIIDDNQKMRLLDATTDATARPLPLGPCHRNPRVQKTNLSLVVTTIISVWGMICKGDPSFILIGDWLVGWRKMVSVN